ncbi:MAG: MMPL family transporter [Thermoanaerobaculia bacterium]
MVEASLIRLAHASMARPRRAIGIMVLVTLATAPGLARLQLRTDGHALMPGDDPVVRFDAEVRQHFHLRDPIVVLIETAKPEGIYNLDTMRRVQQLSDALTRLPGVGRDEVMSLATEHRDRVYPGTLSFRPFLDPLPDTPQLLETLRGDVDAAAILKGTLVSKDAKAVSIFVGAPNTYGPERTELYRRILATVKPYETASDRIVVAGAPVAESLLGTHILEDLKLLVPLALVVILLACWWGTRRIAAVLIALTKIGACLLWVYGLMGLLGVPVYLTTAILPVILITASLVDEIHLLWWYQEVLGRTPAGSPHVPSLRTAIGEMARPIVLTSLTTAAGFFSFVTSTIRPVATFGLFAGFAMIFCLIWTFTVVPATVVLLPADRLRRPGGAPADGKRLLRLLSPLLARPRLTLGALLAITVVLGLGIARLKVQDSWIDGFSPGSPFRRATEEVNARLLGSHILLVHVALNPPPERIPEVFDRKGPLLDPAALEALGRFEAFLRAQPGVGGVLGPHSHLLTVAYLWQARREQYRRIPDSATKVDQLIKLFNQARSERRRQEVIDDDLSRTVVSIYLKGADYRHTARLMAAIRGYEKTHLAPLGMKLGFAGDVAVSQVMIPAIVDTQVSSLLLALAGCWLVISLLHRSAVTGLWDVLPACVAVLWVFGLMGWLAVPLGVATSMFCSITLGIGVDYAIHFMARFQLAQAAGAPQPHLQALVEAAPAIVIDSVAIALGFGLLAFSQVPANERLGLLVGAALLSCCLLTLVGLGALLPLVGLRSRR